MSWYSNNQDYANEEDYLKSLKKDESYFFSYSFEYIAKIYENEIFDIEKTNMYFNIGWSDALLGYIISYNMPKCLKLMQ